MTVWCHLKISVKYINAKAYITKGVEFAKKMVASLGSLLTPKLPVVSLV